MLDRHRLPETGLELTAEGRQQHTLVAVDVGHRVPGVVAPEVARVVAIGVRDARRLADGLVDHGFLVGHCVFWCYWCC